ncbi:MAG: bifunctional phosphopantothenoylcysteine decarboxylase/phosphopantothenate--cysteine ligase CoaBC [Leptolyngbyaceae cyanobacterium SM1_1_3]|nr:bifunctional phosphopantothenoylcysteine decarboxylase/phosphopantothenate--cysteine ligase CoaBC [Leptolyngbyaceae cyanobacterium SM1_1_3]NJN02029.1 bifunctional phosphopantothenoylcysteine decarboxylase/phosphopantothenate--cysteine ligase CoaBC [Leptolyngbyaceae cyanobacterium RM1_1_2]NJO08305.1 bifunctional phosphopantothenoylcysteine decarboxylase/phosphopantothenate--cysteine ligase CoaBC [Leptolyngbyaceae cyanobacterium SL_1_1]
MNKQTSKRILLGVGGGIAAYKICEVASALTKQGILVRAVLTEAAQRFVAPLTFATLCRHPAYTDSDFWQANQGRPLHIELAEWADVILVAPLTANTLAKLTYGLADNLLTNTLLASTCPVLLAPAMNTDMWQQTAVQRNWTQLCQEPRYHTVGPGAGRLACDRVGEGRLAEPAEILSYLQSLLYSQGQRDLSGKQLLISAGSTREYLDPVRFIGNPSTGKMGIALTQAAHHRGGAVTLVHGPIADSLMQTLPPVRTYFTPGAADMREALLAEAPQADWIIMAAAVADVRPTKTASQKLPKQVLPSQLPLETVPDIVAELGQIKRSHQKLIGFAAQTGDVVPPALYKLTQKRLDAIVANPVDQPDSGFGSDRNQAIFIDKSGEQQAILPCSKLTMAHQILSLIYQSSLIAGST